MQDMSCEKKTCCERGNHCEMKSDCEKRTEIVSKTLSEKRLVIYLFDEKALQNGLKMIVRANFRNTLIEG